MFKVLGGLGAGFSGCLGCWVFRVLDDQGAGCSGCLGCWVFMVFRVLGVQSV